LLGATRDVADTFGLDGLLDMKSIEDGQIQGKAKLTDDPFFALPIADVWSMSTSHRQRQGDRMETSGRPV